MEERVEYHSDSYTHADTCTRCRGKTYILVGSTKQCMWKKEYSTSVIIETATLHAGTCTRSRVITYLLDSSMEQCM